MANAIQGGFLPAVSTGHAPQDQAVTLGEQLDHLRAVKPPRSLPRSPPPLVEDELRRALAD
eukprot:CAMPEP_0119390716 /NCGR_PEP_ID=MMETSP1334-20130426/114453_1 /TAXON_ID=127549 /ORGANISM="Calcidiscus leptoporus, Strain RCC1130" /LENGTH=60 /DNA_ID=CAMNT_0007413277 /DNA_START=278 /DNA_END=458 /DNA_ORIENTATION=+